MRRFLGSLSRYAGWFFTNWRSSDATLATKMWLTVRNRTKALVTLKGCCGHLGEPGC
jgi:hypothetical protein